MIRTWKPKRSQKATKRRKTFWCCNIANMSHQQSTNCNNEDYQREDDNDTDQDMMGETDYVDKYVNMNVEAYESVENAKGEQYVVCDDVEFDDDEMINMKIKAQGKIFQRHVDEKGKWDPTQNDVMKREMYYNLHVTPTLNSENEVVQFFEMLAVSYGFLGEIPEYIEEMMQRLHVIGIKSVRSLVENAIRLPHILWEQSITKFPPLLIDAIVYHGLEWVVMNEKRQVMTDIGNDIDPLLQYRPLPNGLLEHERKQNLTGRQELRFPETDAEVTRLAAVMAAIGEGDAKIPMTQQPKKDEKPDDEESKKAETEIKDDFHVKKRDRNNT